MPLTKADEAAAAAGTGTTPASPRQVLAHQINQHYGHLCNCAALMVCKRRHGLPPRQQRDLAEQIVQEALARAWEKADAYQSSRRAVPWLMRFIVNVLREQ